MTEEQAKEILEALKDIQKQLTLLRHGLAISCREPGFLNQETERGYSLSTKKLPPDEHWVRVTVTRE